VAAESNRRGWGVPLRLEDDVGVKPLQLAYFYMAAARKHNQETEERDTQRLHDQLPQL